MSSLPKHPEIVHALNPLADKYFELGTQLDIEYQQLKKIEDNYKGSQSRCLIETIILWQQNNATDKCTWSALAKAVERIGGYDNLVKELEVRDHDAMESQRHVSSMIVDRSSIHVPSITPSQSQTRDSRRPLRHDSTESADESGYSSKSESGESSGSETECFELSPGCGCTNKKPCSLYKVCAGECPNPTGKRVPILRKRCTASPQHEIPFEEEPDCEDYEESTREIQRSFGDFVLKTSQIFQANNVNIEALNLYIQSAYPVMKPRMDEMSKATSMDNVFRIIVDQSCSWFDYEIIKDLIHRFCTSAKSCLAEYNARFEKYTEQRLPKGKKHIKVGHGARKGGKQLVIKIDREWEEVTFSDLDKLRGTFASILGIRRKDLYLADIREGCIMMTFMITEELADSLFPSRRCLNPSQVKSLKDEGVLSVMCGSFSWRAASNNRCDRAQPERKAKVMPQNSFGWKSDSMIFDIRVVVTVMLLLAMVFAGGCRIFVCSMPTQVRSIHTRADIFILSPKLRDFSIRYKHRADIFTLLEKFLESSRRYEHRADISPKLRKISRSLSGSSGPMNARLLHFYPVINHTQAYDFTLDSLPDKSVRHISFLRSCPLIAGFQSCAYSGSYPAYYLSTKVIRQWSVTYCTDSSDHGQTNHEGPTSPRWKQGYNIMVLAIDSVDSNSLHKYFLNTSRESLACGIQPLWFISSYRNRWSVHLSAPSIKGDDLYEVNLPVHYDKFHVIQCTSNGNENMCAQVDHKILFQEDGDALPLPNHRAVIVLRNATKTQATRADPSFTHTKKINGNDSLQSTTIISSSTCLIGVLSVGLILFCSFKAVKCLCGKNRDDFEWIRKEFYDQDILRFGESLTLSVHATQSPSIANDCMHNGDSLTFSVDDMHATQSPSIANDCMHNTARDEVLVCCSNRSSITATSRCRSFDSITRTLPSPSIANDCMHNTAGDEVLVCCSNGSSITATSRCRSFDSITRTLPSSTLQSISDSTDLSLDEDHPNCGDQKADSNYSVEKANPIDADYEASNHATQHKLEQNPLDIINENKHGTNRGTY